MLLRDRATSEQIVDEIGSILSWSRYEVAGAILDAVFAEYSSGFESCETARNDREFVDIVAEFEEENPEDPNTPGETKMLRKAARAALKLNVAEVFIQKAALVRSWNERPQPTLGRKR